MITPDEIVKMVESGDCVYISHSRMAEKIMNEWYTHRSKQGDWLKNSDWYEMFYMLGVVFFAGTVYGKRELRHRKRRKEIT